MPEIRDLKLLMRSQMPLIIVESNEEKRVIDLFKRTVQTLRKPLFQWSVTRGLQRLDMAKRAQKFNQEPIDLLRHIESVSEAGVFLLLDFHPYLDQPLNVRMLREIAQNHTRVPHHIVLLSPEFEIPRELLPHTTKFKLQLPDFDRVMDIIKRVANEWMRTSRKKVLADKKAVKLLAQNLIGLTASDAERLARKAIYNDGAITACDMRLVQQAKYDLIDQKGVLSFEYETANFAEVGGLAQLKRWLELRKAVFEGQGSAHGLEPPKGLMLLGVQGCGKSLAAKAVAGMWQVPLLRIDFGSLMNKYIGETEHNLRRSLETAEVMAPCVLWADEIEKGLSSSSGDDGVSRRVLGTLLTWMAEKKKPVFMVATANDVSVLPPELLRKGRFDEIFFVDLPSVEVRSLIFQIQARKRKLHLDKLDFPRLAEVAQGFSGAEIEQAIVSSIYVALAHGAPVTQGILEEEITKTRPLSVVMAEKIDNLRRWARDRTVLAD